MKTQTPPQLVDAPPRERAPAAPPDAAVRPICAGPTCGSLFDVVNDAIFVHDAATGAVLDVNRAAEEMYETTRDVLRAEGVEAFSLGEPPYSGREALAHIQAAAAGRPQLFEWRARTRTGRLFWVEVNLKSVSAAGCQRLFAVVRDVTDRKRAEEALRESEQKLRLLANAMPQIVCVLGPDGSPEYVSPTWTAYSGLDLAATRRAGWDGVLHPDDVEAARACRRRAIERLEPHDVELRYRRADGSYRWFLSRLAPIVEGTRVVRLVGAAMDIEDRKRGEQALRDQLALKDQLSKVAASVPGVVCSFRLRPDGASTMPFSAPAIVDLYGFGQDELARDMTPVFARMHPVDAARVREEVAASARDLTRWRAVFRYDHPTKGWRWIEGTSIPAREADGGVLWHGYVADVTERCLADEERRRSGEQLREEHRRKDEFLGMLSHELRNPLAPIRNSVYLLRHGAAADRASHALLVIERQTQHLTRLVDDLLDVTRIARGKIQLRRERVDVRELVRRTGEDFRSMLDDRGVAFQVAVPDRAVPVDADATRLAQVVGNLLHNAAKFTRRGDAVAASVEVRAGAAVIRVRDTGAGIDPALLTSVFDPFVQADRTLARTEGGLGLGLALVKGIVDLHGGSVRVESAGTGKGTEFTVELPLAVAAEELATEEPARSAGRPGRRVLVVDDNRDAAESLAQVVRVLGHDADVAYDGESALAKVRASPPDAVLCDLGLPDMDGYEVARRIRAFAAAGLLLVAVSGYAQPEDVARTMEAGFDAHVAKPADLDELEELIG